MRLGIGLATLVSLGTAAFVLVQMDRYVGSPYPGFFLLPGGGVSPLAPRAGVVEDLGLRTGDRVVEVDGRPVATGQAFWSRVQAIPSGETFEIEVASAERGRRRVQIAQDTFTRGDFQRAVLPVVGAGLLLLALGTFAGLARPDLSAARAMFLVCWAVATGYCFLGFDANTAAHLNLLSSITGGVARAGLLHLALTFPSHWIPAGRRGALLVLGLYGAMLLQSAVFALAYGRAPTVTRALDGATYLSTSLGLGLIVANMVWTAVRARDSDARRRARVALAGPGIGSALACVMLLLLWSGFGIRVELLALGVLTFALGAVYAMLRRNIFEVDAVLLRSVTLAVSVAGLGLVYLALLALASQFVSQTGVASALASALVFVALVPLVQPVRERIEGSVETVLFPARQQAVAEIHGIGQELARARGVDEVGRLVRGAACRAMKCSSARLLLWDEARYREIAHASDDPPQIERSDPLSEAIEHSQASSLDCGRSPAPEVAKRFEDLEVRMLVPIPGGASRGGALLLGARDDGRLYTSDDAALLETLASQAGNALENARVWDEVSSLQRSISEENAQLRREVRLQREFEEIVGSSLAIRAVLAQVERVGPTDSSVLVVGETGTGKELFVRALHRLSLRSGRPLVKVACAAIPETLLESELFGHEKGAFTGAVRRQPGRFEVADGGTIFFDDVDTLPLAIQAKLLRAIQEGEIQRLGSAQSRRVDVRVLAATNRDLLAEVRAGRFRQDLFYRLNVVPLELPPLRERRDDLPLLIDHFITKESEKLGREVRPLAASARDALLAHDWPGNVRELKNAIERAVVLSDGGEIELPGPIRASPARTEPSGPSDDVRLDGRPLSERVQERKEAIIRAALVQTRGNQSAAAELLGLHRQSLSRTIRELGIEVPRDG